MEDTSVYASENDLRSDRRNARLAAILFFVIGLPTYAWGPEYSLSKVVVSRDPASTFNNLLANEFIFRTGVLAHLVNVVAALFTALLLYRIFRPVNRHLSLLMIIPPVVQIVLVLLLELLDFTALLIAKGEVLMGADQNEKQEIVYSLFRVHHYGLHSFKFFWALFMIALGVLINRSGFAPRIIGLLSVIGGAAHVMYGSALILMQRQAYLKAWPYMKVPMIIGLMVPMLWFLIKGVSDKKYSTNKQTRTYNK